MLRRIIIAALSIGAFAGAFAAVRAVRDDHAARQGLAPFAGSSPSAAADTLQLQAPQAVSTRLPRGRAPTPSPTIPNVQVTRRGPTPYEALVLERAELFYPMKLQLQRAIAADKHLTRPCFEGTDLVGETTLEFSWLLESTPEHAKASGLRYVQVSDGVAIPASVATCIEHALRGTYEAVPNQFAFTDFRGEIPLRLSWTLEPATR